MVWKNLFWIGLILFLAFFAQNTQRSKTVCEKYRIVNFAQKIEIIDVEFFVKIRKTISFKHTYSIKKTFMSWKKCTKWEI